MRAMSEDRHCPCLEGDWGCPISVRQISSVYIIWFGSENSIVKSARFVVC